MPAPHEITPPQLLRLIGLPDRPEIVDICLPEDFAAAPTLIPGALRHRHDDVDGLIVRLGGRPTVVVCQKGRKLSQGLAALLRTRGVRAEYLSGGALAWQALDGAPNLPTSVLPGIGEAPTLWVTRHRPKIDRIACPWLIRRFIDHRAQFLFVAPDEVAAVAERFDAQPFDIEGVRWSHHGSGCTFDRLLDEFCLRTQALNRLSEVVRAADLGQPDSVPQAAGLLALSVGLSRQYRDDLEQLEAALPLYDALYRWARDGSGETHASALEGGQ
ncbi:MAG: sulfurtransferase/chromate resistance protein [Sulfitobacter sp.]|nr:sulfurtransferase/chromate resistance protein [Sulfitobacter sp.]